MSQIRGSESNLSKASSGSRISIAEPLPLPKIHVQHPTDASEIRETRPKTPPPQETIDSCLAEEHKAAFEAAKARITQDIAKDVAKIAERPTETAEEEAQVSPPKELRPKKSAIVLRKTRNAMVREFFLRGLLGRDFAEPTKRALRKRAKGEYVTIEDVSVDLGMSLSKAQKS